MFKITTPFLLLLVGFLPQERWSKEITRVRTLLVEQDSFAAVEYIQSQGSPQTVAALYDAVNVHILQKDKDVRSFVRLSLAGIHYELTMAQLSKTPKEAQALRSAAKTLAYNLAANVWQGWGKGTFAATKDQQRLGLDAARLNLRLAKELKKGPLKISYAWWMLAASQMGLGDHKAAMRGFRAAAAAAKKAEKPATELSALGFLAVTRILAGQVDSGKADLAQVRQDLTALAKKGDEDAAFYASQFAPALAAFAPKKK